MIERRHREVPASNAAAWYQRPLLWSLVGGVLLWAAFPPLDLPPLAWLAPVFWLWLVRVETLPGRRAYLAIWLGAAVHWLAMLQGIRLAYWANAFGWIALSLYLAGYLPLFVALTRWAVHRWRVSLIVAAPVVWTGLELARGHLLTGFSMGMLGHTQVEWTALLQIADVFGAYGVSFLVMFAAACLVRILPWPDGRRWTFWPLAPLVCVIAATLAYGHYRLGFCHAPPATPPPLKVALIQGDVDTRFEYNPQRNRDTFELYFETTRRACDRHPDVDLVIWPESVFTENHPEFQREPDFQLPPQARISPRRFAEHFEQNVATFQQKVAATAHSINRFWQDGSLQSRDIYLLAGTETHVYGSDKVRHYNTALLIDPAGQVVDRYYKMHPVMFGEYLPFGNLLPWIYRWTPMSEGLTPGDRAESFQVAGMRLAPSICFESAVAHLIRRQVLELTAAGESPDVLVNITHDGWFRNSSVLDLQFAGAVFRAIELRRPMLVAANAGVSCWIDGNGRVLARGRKAQGELVVDVYRDGRTSFYLRFGDVAAGACLLACLLLAGSAVLERLRRRRRGQPQE